MWKKCGYFFLINCWFGGNYVLIVRVLQDCHVNKNKVVSSVNISDTAEYRLYNALFTSYNPMLRPRAVNHETIEVEVEYELSSVSGLDEVNQVMTTLGFIVAMWHDDFLQWDIEDYGNITHLVIPATKVWLPDCGIQNSAKTFTDSNYWEDFRVDVQYDGRVIWKFGGIFMTSCTLDMTFYPFDMQKCDIIVENWAYTDSGVNLTHTVDEIHLQEYSPNGEWTLDHTRVSYSTYTEDTHPGKLFPKITFSIYITRKFQYYMINIVLPALFVISIALMVFWLPPDSGEKVSLGVTVLLAFSVFQLVIMEHTPRTSDYTPLMTLLFTIIMGSATFSVLTSILVLYYHHHGVESRPPKIIRYIAFKILARVLCMRRQIEKVNYKDVQMDNMENVNEKLEGDDLKNFEKSNGIINPKHNNFIGGMEEVVDQYKAKKDNMNIEDYLKEMLIYIKEMRQNVCEKESEEYIINEWKCLARIVDRAMFWFAFVVLIITVPIMLLLRDESHT